MKCFFVSFFLSFYLFFFCVVFYELRGFCGRVREDCEDFALVCCDVLQVAFLFFILG